MDHPLFGEALTRAAARRGWLEPGEIARVAAAIAAGTSPAEAAPQLAIHLPELLPPSGHPGFGGWRALARLGGGSMGAVWLAAADGRLAVIKTAATAGRAPLLGSEAGGSVWLGGAAESARPSPDEELAQRFAREARITASLAHPRIVPCLDGGVAADGTRYLVLAWVAHGDLAAELARGGPLRPAAALAVADQLADALEYAHAQGVVHRDLKAANVFVHPDGAVLLGDFGLARPTSAGATRLTLAGVAVGTPNTMAPEQIDGRDAIDGRADLYALGCLLFACLAGRPPFSGRSAEVMQAHRTAPPPDLDTAVPGLPPGIGALVARLMAKRPEDRPDSAATVRRALVPLLAACGARSGEPVPLRLAPPAAPATTATAAAADPGDALLLHGATGDPTLVVWGRLRIVLGKQRTAGVDLVVRDYPEEAHRERIQRVSRRHAALAIAADGAVTIEDLGSANGTSVEGKALPPGTPLRLAGPAEVVLGGVATLRVRPLPGAVVLERTGNRRGLVYALVHDRLRLGTDGDLPLPGATAAASLERRDGGWGTDGGVLGDRLVLGDLELRVAPLGDFL